VTALDLHESGCDGGEDEPRLPAILESTVGGSAEALGWLFCSFGPLVHRVAFRITRSGAEADDVVQDVFVRLPEALRRFDGRSPFERWIASVAAREALSHLRRGRSRRQEVLSEAGGAYRAPSSDPLEVIAIRDAIAALDPDLRAVLVLRAEGFSHREIAQALGISPGNSEVRLFRARLALRGSFGET
jgi:RNA polymerase sigma-70 factor, ECF subfamily